MCQVGNLLGKQALPAGVSSMLDNPPENPRQAAPGTVLEAGSELLAPNNSAESEVIDDAEADEAGGRGPPVLGIPWLMTGVVQLPP